MKNLLTTLLLSLAITAHGQTSTPPVTYLIRHNANGSNDTIRNYWTDSVIMNYVATHGGGGGFSSQTLTDDVTIDGDNAYLVSFQALSDFLVSVENGTIISTDNGSMTATVGFDVTNTVYDNIAGTITDNASGGVYTTTSYNVWDGTNPLAYINADETASRVYTSSTDGNIGSGFQTYLDGSGTEIQMCNADNYIDIFLSTSGTTINFTPPSYADDAAAISDGLFAGDWYQNSVTHVLTVVQ